MTAFAELPYLQEGTFIQQVSTHDRSGGNWDGWYGAYSHLYQDENGEYVLMDDVGAGCVVRMWTTYNATHGNATNRFRIYFDGEEVPRVDTTLGAFFSGTNAPFLFPLTGDEMVSSGGYFSYVPLPYESRCKVTVSDVQDPFYYNLAFHRYDVPDGIQTWTGEEDLSGAMQVWTAVGVDPKSAETPIETVSGVTNLSGFGEAALLVSSQPGTVASIKIDPAAASSNWMANVWIQMTWDGAAEPQVNAPIGEFFGSGFGELEVQSLPIGMSSSNAWYCYFPMPFWSSADIRLENRGAVSVSNLLFEIQTVSNRYDAACSGHFYAAARRAVLTSSDRDYVVLDEDGRGHYVGCVLSMTASHDNETLDMRYLEGDERIYIDGSPSPAIYGTGNEDYFNGGWYFKKGPFSRACHGAPYLNHDVESGTFTNSTCAYRFHLSDVVPFRSHIRFGVEHGDSFHNATRNLPGAYSSVAYFYKQPETGLILAAELNIGDATSEQAASYAFAGAAVSNSWCYEGVNDDLLIADSGVLLSNSCSFSVPVAVGNKGVVLRRRTDQGLNPQAGNVFVDGVFVGTWSLVDTNFADVDPRWTDAEFYIPWPLTAGKTNLNIRIEPTSGSWNEYRYQVYSVVPLVPTDDMDEDGLPDRWEAQFFADIRSALPEQDADADGYSTVDEWIAGTNPEDSDSVFRIHPGVPGQSLTWAAVSGRVYTVSVTTNLLQEFQLVKSKIPWTESGFAITNSSPAAYYRVDVELGP